MRKACSDGVDLRGVGCTFLEQRQASLSHGTKKRLTTKPRRSAQTMTTFPSILSPERPSQSFRTGGLWRESLRRDDSWQVVKEMQTDEAVGAAGGFG